MPSAPKLPPAPSPGQIGDTQFQFNQQAQGQNTINQNDPYGQLTYTMSTDPITGRPKYVANQNYSAPEQARFGGTEMTGIEQALTGAGLAGNLLPSLSQAPNFTEGADSLTAQAQAPVNAAFERFMAPQRAQLDTQLRNSGILPGTPAYQQQVDALNNQQNLTKGQWEANFQPQAFQEAQQSYFAPEQMLQSLFRTGAPANLQQQWINPPQVQAANANAAYQTNLDQANKIAQWKAQGQNNMMGGIFGLAENAAPFMFPV